MHTLAMLCGSWGLEMSKSAQMLGKYISKKPCTSEPPAYCIPECLDKAGDVSLRTLSHNMQLNRYDMNACWPHWVDKPGITTHDTPNSSQPGNTTHDHPNNEQSKESDAKEFDED